MPAVDNALVGYVKGSYVYEDSDGNLVPYDTSFVPDWRVDNDPRLVAEYAADTLSQRYEDRTNDEYLDDATSRAYFHNKGDVVQFGSEYRTKDDAKSYTPAPGYDILGNGVVRCWFCDGEVNFLAFRSGWVRSDKAMREFVKEMLTHYYACKAEHDGIPWLRTYVRAGVRRPNGEVILIPEHARKVTKPWQVKGALL